MISVLFARRDSIYKTMPGCDVWDIDRDASNWPGGRPVVAHPPCRAWGRLKHFAKPREGEKDLARQAIAHVRRWGGVLEHPQWSTLWEDQNLPLGRVTDAWGGVHLPTHVVARSRNRGAIPEVTKAEREHTPTELARWLVAVATLAASQARAA